MISQIEKVCVSNIVEYNWMLGNRCYLLQNANLHPYINTEEEIMGFLEESAKDPDMLAVCCESSRCGAFYESFRNGETPFFDKDPVKLLEYKGRYWVYEGKHRVCMAIRSKTEYIYAQVYHLDKDTETLLEHQGMPGSYSFTATYGMRRFPFKGRLAILWLNPPRGMDYSPFSVGPIILNSYMKKTQQKEEVIPGVFVEIKRKRLKGLFRLKSIEATVTIEQNHYNTAIWLYTISANRKDNIYSEPKTVFRYGRWRKKHLPYMIPNTPF